MARIAPVMQDGGRGITDFQQNCDTEAAIMAKFGIKNNAQYREFLQSNADDVIKQTRMVSLCTNFEKCDGSQCQCVLCQSCRSAFQPDTPFITFTR